MRLPFGYYFAVGVRAVAGFPVKDLRGIQAQSGIEPQPLP